MQRANDSKKVFECITHLRMWTSIATMLITIILIWSTVAHASSNYRKRITIDHNRVSSDCSHLENFAVLINIKNDPQLKSTAYDGHVFNANGYDIIFKDENSNQLDHELLNYSAASGSLLAFVRLPLLSSGSDTIFYLHYGDPLVSSSQENVAGVWDDNYAAVLHLQESGNGNSDEYSDSSGNGHHGTGGGLAGAGDSSLTPNLTNGLFGYAQNFDGSNDRIRLYNVDDSSWSAVTVQAWINPDDNGDDRIFGKCWGTGTSDQTWLLRQTGYKIGSRMQTNTDNNKGFDRNGLSAGSWFLSSVTWDATDNKLRVFLNGNELGSATLYGSTMYSNPSVSQPTIGNIPGGGRDFDGQLQEARVSNVARSGCWLKTEFNNQISPYTFYSVGIEEGASPLYTISAMAGAGGIITPVGNVIVEAGNDQVFDIIAADNYEINDVIVDGISKGSLNSWQFTSVSADHSIKVTFAEIVNGDEGDATPLNACGAIDVGVDYHNGFSASTLKMINTQIDDTTGHVMIKTGFAAIDKEKIIVPFDQEVFVNMLYTAGRNDLGYSLIQDVVDENNNFIGWNNIPVVKRHGFFRGTWDDAYAAGDGIFDESYGYGNFPINSESGIAAYDDGTGFPFLVDGDGIVTPRDMRKSLGTFAAGTEIVLWMVRGKNGAHYDDVVLSDYDLEWVYFNKHEWNPDYYQSCDPGYSPFDKIYRLSEPGVEGTCFVDGGWLQPGATGRLLTHFNLTMSDSTYTMPIEVGEKYHHFIVGAPANDPNQWILGIEQNNNQHITSSDIDCNDMVYKLERQTGGMVELDDANAISSGSANTSFTGVTLNVWDYIPCPSDNKINYQLSIDNGLNWVDITNWDEIFISDANKNIGNKIENINWEPGNPAHTYRTRRVDFSGLGLSGHQIRWRANMVSQDEACEPRILDLAVSATVMGDAEVSRAAPVLKANLLYSGSYEIKGSGNNEELRGHLKTTRIFDPAQPDTTTGDIIWDAGAKLNDKSPNDRNIYIPYIIVSTAAEQVGVGDGVTTNFIGTIGQHPILAETLVITDAHESLSDKHTDELEGNLGGSGKVDRFSGEFSIEFNTAPGANVPIMAHFEYYSTNSNLLSFTKDYVSTDMLDIDDTFIIGKGFTYDFDGDGNFETDDDRQWLINWVRGYKDGSSLKKDWILGAIDHSAPALQTPPSLPDWYYGTAVTKKERSEFLQFVENNKNRKTVVFVGARDGMLHAFDAGDFRHQDSGVCPEGNNRGCFLNENYGTGEELWAFIPANLIPRLKNNVLQGSDQAYVDASPALADVKTGGQWRTVLLSAQGNGGDTIFCLDVTDPEDPKFMWEFADPDLFRSRSSPSVGKIGRILVGDEAVWVSFFVSGKTYNASL